MKLKERDYTFIGLILILCLFGIKNYYYDKPIDRDSLTLIKGTLTSTPYLGETGGDVPKKFIKFKIRDANFDIHIKSCGYEKSKLSSILSITDDTVLYFLIDEKSMYINKKYAYDIKMVDGTSLLSLDDYNNCFTNGWRSTIYFIIATIILYILIILWDLYREKYGVPPVRRIERNFEN